MIDKMHHHVFRIALSSAFGAMLGGCAVGNVGALAAHVERKGTVAVLSLHSIGLHLRTRADDPGAHLGYSQRSYVFAADAALEPGWYLLRVPMPEQDAVAQDLMVVGIEFAAAAPAAGMTFGYSRQRLYARLAADASAVIVYRGPGLQVDTVHLCKQEDETCAIASLRR